MVVNNNSFNDRTTLLCLEHTMLALVKPPKVVLR